LNAASDLKVNSTEFIDIKEGIMVRIILVLLVILLLGNISHQETDEPEATPEATAEPTSNFPGAGSYTIQDTIGNLERTYRIYIPDSAEPMPLVIVLHGAGGTGAWIESFSGFNDLADEEKFAVVYPNGINRVWNDGRVGDTRIGNIDDVGFMTKIIDFLSEKLDIEGVYVAGYSMGGMLSFRLACEMPDTINAIASVASTFPEYLVTACADTAPVSVLIIQGTDDPVVPWAGVRGGYLSAVNSLTYWANHNGCTIGSEISVQDDVDTGDHTRILREGFSACDDNADVTLYGIFYGGHTWPGRPFEAPFQLGLTSADMDATQAIWAFFAAHS
jgi:polyhydroxybutyrate depolymerase